MTTFSDVQKNRALALVRRFESGRESGNYSAVAVLDDGAGISYGAFQFTHRSGLLAETVERYLMLGGTTGAGVFRQMLPMLRRLGPATIRKTAADQRFREALREAGETPEMRQAQQDVADKKLLAPAIAQCERLGFRSALGLAVVLDSITHGSWERIAAKAGIADRQQPERQRIIRYLETRQRWLLSSRRLRRTVYRTAALLEFARSGNLGLEPRFRRAEKPNPSSSSLSADSSAAATLPQKPQPSGQAGGETAEHSAAPAATAADDVSAVPLSVRRPMDISLAAESAARGLETAFERFDRADRLIDGIAQRSSRLRSLWAAVIGSIWQTLWALIGFFAGLPAGVWLVVAIICAAITLAFLLRQAKPVNLPKERQ
jgi:hypothetical protein